MNTKIFYPLLLLLISCHHDQFPNYHGSDEIIHGQGLNVVYKGIFQPIHGRSKGHYLIWLKENQFYVRIIFSKLPKNFRIRQYVHEGSQCPSLKDDSDGDRKLNLSETTAISGPVLFPLDGNLESQYEGSDWFPISNDQGIFYYSRSASFKRFIRDLQSPGSVPLALHTRVLVLYLEKANSLDAFTCAPIQVRFN